ncbi:exported protein of unknown function (plasmid) [Cupriavidus taiwanensis]|uniref:Uncharacterized protein n=1 Tax=Cupriavidus taiwanensis TaxID=164546 RepID=A0A375IMU7_9BURK|nr:hypothetical protein [Cupriavidus taiwanensis]SPK75986.1 exported protein of unknown function [Cupriavidus taiwanensis]
MKTDLFLLCTALTLAASFEANAGPDWQVIEKARAHAVHKRQSAAAHPPLRLPERT